MQIENESDSPTMDTVYKFQIPSQVPLYFWPSVYLACFKQYVTDQTPPGTATLTW